MSEVLYSELEFSYRIDSEYYRPSLIKHQNMIQRKGGKELKNFSNFLIGPFGSSFTVDNYIDNPDYRYIRGKDVKPLRLQDDDNVYMPKSDYKRLERYALKENDILVTVVGTLGNAALVTKKDLPAIFSCKSTVIRTHSINPVYLLVYINCKYGQELLNRKERGAIQKGFNLGDLETLDVFEPSVIFQEKIESFFRKSLQYVEKSKNLYTQAEDLLLAEVGLKDFSPSTEAVNIKSFSESFGTSGRLDAEYYQPKYEDYLNMIYQYNNGYEILSAACELKDANYTPIDEKQYQYIELSNIGNSGDINGCTLDFGKELPSRARRKVNTGNVIISSIEGSLSSCALVTEKYNNTLCSTGFYVLKSEKINPETLLVLFKSEILQAILKQNCSGTILTAINKNEFLNIPLPIIPLEKQQQIAQLVEQSFALKAESEQLLEVAKRAVEIAIEQDEDIALEYIKRKII